MYNYLGVIRKSTAISYCVSCYFFDTKNPNLVLSKNNRIEFYHLTPEGISQDKYIDIYGKIKILLSIPNQQNNIKYNDNLFILSSDLDYCLFSYNFSNNNIDSPIKGTIREDLGQIEDNIVYSLDSKKNYLLLYAYKNIFKIICVNNNMRLNDIYKNYTIKFNYENILFLAPLLYDKPDNKNIKNQDKENDNNILTFIAIKSEYIENKTINNNNSNLELKQGIFLESFDIDMDPSSFDPPKLLYKKLKIESNNKTKNINFNNKYKRQIYNSQNDNSANSNNDNNIKNTKNSQLSKNKNNNINKDTTIKYNHQKLFDSKVFLRILNVEENGNINLMITHPDGLIIIFFSKIVFYFKYNPCNSIISTSKSMAYDERKFVDYVTVDEKNYKYYVIDENGTLFLLGFLDTKKNRKNMEFGIINLQILGKVNNCSCMAYLTNNILFIGSTKCNSQLIRINKRKDNDATFQIEVIEEYESLSPISNIALINNTKEENGIEILTISGTESNCSIKNIKKGKNVLFSGEIEIKNIVNVFKIIINNIGNKESKNDNAFKYCSFIITTLMKSFIVNYDYKNKIISLNDSFSFKRNELVKYAKNIKNLILIITNINIYFYKNNSELTLLSNYSINKFASNSFPLIIKYNKNQCGLYIYYNNNNMIKYKIDDDGKIISNEVILKNASISAFDIFSYFMIYSFWDSNQIGIYSFNSNKINYISEFGEFLNFSYITSIQIIKINDEYFIFISLSIGKMIYLKLRNKINESYINYEFKSEDFIVKNSYNLNLENFKIKKLKKKNQKFMFLDFTFPCFIFFNHNNLIISNFNANHCKDIIVLDNENNYYMFIFNDRISFGSLSNNQNQNIYTLKNGKVINIIKLLDFGKNDDISVINNKRINKYKQMKYILTIEEEELDNVDEKSIVSSLIINDLNMKEISRYNFEYDNEINMTLTEINLPQNEENIKYFIIGTGITDAKRSEPVIGHLYLIEINIRNKFSIKKLQEKEIEGGVYKIDVYQNIIYVGTKNILKIYSINKKHGQNFYEFKLLRQCTDFMLINNIYVLKDKNIQEEEEKDIKKDENKDTDKTINKIFICDLYKSIMLYNYDITNDKLTEESRDYNLTWIYNVLQCFPNLIYITDIDDNIITLEKIYHSKNEKDKLKLERKSYFNYGERINILKSTEIINKDLASLTMNTSNEDDIELNNNKAIKNDILNDNVKITYFGTMEGSVGYIIPLNKETYEFLYVLQEILIKKLSNNGGFNYKKWRSFKDGYISNEPKGYIEGEIISKFLSYDNNYKKIIIKEMNYPWKKSIFEIDHIIETLNKFC